MASMAMGAAGLELEGAAGVQGCGMYWGKRCFLGSWGMRAMGDPRVEGNYVGDGWPRRVLLVEAGKAIAGVDFVGAKGVLSHPFPCGLSPRAVSGEKPGCFTERCRFNKWQFPVSILPAGEWTGPGPGRASPPPCCLAAAGPGALFRCSLPSLSLPPGVLCPIQGSLPSVLPSCLRAHHRPQMQPPITSPRHRAVMPVTPCCGDTGWRRWGPYPSPT